MRAPPPLSPSHLNTCSPPLAPPLPPGDPDGLEPDLAAGLRRVAREGLGAPLADLEVQGSGDDEEEEEDNAR